MPPRLLVPLSIQHMFAMFGASVLVPFMFDINPAIVLFAERYRHAAVHLHHQGQSARLLRLVVRVHRSGDAGHQNWGYPYALGGFVVVGLCGCRHGGSHFTNAAQMDRRGAAACRHGSGRRADRPRAGRKRRLHWRDRGDGVTTASVITFCVTLGVAVLGSVLFRKFLSVIRS